ncbi:CDP-glycerol glycerophosphotransferase family protein [Pseudomonas sihuiensis]|uniref:Rhamnan synthesis protein F n=1 Tax=Pseudomonas sihuiensis TaxID=1274359 RepID=A0A1H2LNW2_9PSED|nr:CDP-glycerol glycerophosphotransferase family protein [Pseudomonas sihuiensis]SDU82609.1 Rhamnan synthesis protein F [Pseudomonas sihuiensis]
MLADTLTVDESLALIDTSGFFDREWYLTTYDDVRQSGVDPLTHFFFHGAFEGRNPGPAFDTLWYRTTNAQVIEDGENPLLHYLRIGRDQGCLPLQLLTAQVDPQVLEVLRGSPLFDAEYYTANNPIVALCKLDPLYHFCAYGSTNLLDPSREFDLLWYHQRYLREEAPEINALYHYETVGRAAGHATRPEPMPTSLVGRGEQYDPSKQVSLRRVCLFAGYDVDGLVDDYVVEYLRQLSRFADIYYLADCEMEPGQLDRLAPFVKGAWAIRHGAYDFGSYSKLARELVGWEVLDGYDELLLVNDSCYCIRSLDHVFAKMDAQRCDWWGMQATKGIWETRLCIENRFSDRIPLSHVKSHMLDEFSTSYLYDFHVGSYFLVLRRNVSSDPRFRELLSAVRVESNKRLIVVKYEIGFSRFLIQSGYEFSTYIDYLYPLHPMYSMTHFQLIADGMPLFKRLLLTDNNYFIPGLRGWKGLIRQACPQADVSLIEANLQRVANQERLFRSLNIQLNEGGELELPTMLGYEEFVAEDTVLPKHENWWAFPVCGFDHLLTGNDRAVFEWVKDDPGIKKLVFYRSRRPRVTGVNVEYYLLNSLEGQRALMQCRVVFVKHTPMRNAMFPLSADSHIFINLWHGIPLKRIGHASLDQQDNLQNLHVEHARCFSVIASSKLDQLAMAAAFYPLAYEDVWVTGLPRHDFILAPFERLPEDFQAETHKLEAQLAGRRLVLFTPTFRNQQGDAYYRFSDADLVGLAELLARHNAVLGVREHFADSARTYSTQLEKIGAIDLGDRRFPNIEVLFRSATALITDYSSCFFDFLLTNRPVLSLAYDLQRYANDERGMFYDMETVFPGPICTEFPLLLNGLDDAMAAPDMSLDPHYQQVRKLFFSYCDGDNSARLVERVRAVSCIVSTRRSEVKAQLAARGAAPRYAPSPALVSRMPSPAKTRLLREYLGRQGGGPLLGIFVIDREGDRARVEATLASLAEGRNLYHRVQISVVGRQASTVAERAHTIRHVACNGRSYADTLNAELADATIDWFMLVEAGETFTASGLFIAMLELQGADGCRAFYGDEFYRDANGELGAAFRPAFNLDMLLSFPVAMARHWLFQRDAAIEVGGFDAGFEGALEFDLILRLIEHGGLSDLGHVDEPLLVTATPLMKDNPDERKALLRHLHNRGYVAQLQSRYPGRYHIRYAHAGQPLVSIIIPTRDQLPMLQRCVESLLEKTHYTGYEIIIVDNDSQVAEAREWLSGVAALGDDKIRVLSYPGAFNFSAINNAAAGIARGDYLLLLNNDTAIIQDDWLDELLNHAQRPEVGVVGAKLLYPDGRVQHAGVVLGLRGPADHPFIGETLDAPGYMQRLQIDQNYSAVTAACMMVRKSLYEEVGGMDESDFRVSYNDVDLCLKIQQAGYLTVWTPHALVMHEGSVSQKSVDPLREEEKRVRFHDEQQAMYHKWLPVLARDPAYNQNLGLTGAGFNFDASRGLDWRPVGPALLPRVLGHPADEGGCGHYRIRQPFQALQAAGLVEGALSDTMLSPVELERFRPDVVLLQRQTTEAQLERIAEIKAFSNAFKVYELDDYLLDPPEGNGYRDTMAENLEVSLARAVGMSDRFVVSTEPLAEALSRMHGDIRVVPNLLPVQWWKNLKSHRGVDRKPRIGWAGGNSHAGDLALIADLVRQLAGEVDWVFFGMCPDALKPYVRELHEGVPIERYSRKLASLNLDLAIAPLEENRFNECKSNLRLLEYGACGFPVVCSAVRPYEGDLPVTRVRNRFKDWMDAIRMHLSDRDASARQGDELRSVVRRDWMLEGDNLQRWRRAWLPD